MLDQSDAYAEFQGGYVHAAVHITYVLKRML